MSENWGENDKPVTTAINNDQDWGAGDLPAGQKPAGALRRLKQGISNTVDAARVAATNSPEEIAGIMGEADKNRIPASPAQVKMQEEIAPYVKRANEATGVVDNVLAWGSAAAKRAGQFIQNPSEFAGMVAENLPNSAPGMAGGLAGAAVGSSLGPVGTAVGGVVGGTAGGYAVEQGSSMQEQIQKEAQARGVSLQDKAGLTALISEKYPEFLEASRLKGIGTAGTDAALNVATMGLAGAGGRAIAKEARALGEAAKAGKIGATEAAQQLAEIEAKNAARNTLGATVKRGAGVTGAEMLGEGASEAVGQKLGYGNVDAGDVIDESLLGLGTGVGMAAGHKVVNKVTGSREFDPASAEIERARGAIRPQGQTLALPAPSTAIDNGVIQVAPDGTARTPAYQAPDYVGDITDVEPRMKPSEAMGLDPAAGPMSAAATIAVDSGAHGVELQTTQDQQAQQMEQQQAQEAAKLDSTDKPITSGPIAEAAMSDDDKRAVLYSNQPVADGGQRYPGTQDGDILNGSGAPFGTWQAAGRRASMEGKDWDIAKVADGYVARRKDAMASTGKQSESTQQAPAEPDWAAQAAEEERQQGPLQVQPQPKGMNTEQRKANLARLKERMLAGRNNGTTNAVQSLPATGSGVDGNQQTASMGHGNADGNGVGTDTGGRENGFVGEPRQLPGGAPESAVGERFDVTHAGNAAVADPKNADVVSAYNRTQFAQNPDGSTRRVGRDHFESWVNSGGVSSDVGSQYDGHGIAKGNPLGALLNILTNGINTSRRFDSAPLTPASSAAGAGSGLGSANGAYKDGPFILLGERGKSILDGIKTVLVSDEVAASIPALQQRFPNVRFVSHSNAQSVLSQDANVQNAPAAEQPGAVHTAGGAIDRVDQSGEQPTTESAVTDKGKNLASLKEKVLAGRKTPQFTTNPQPSTMGTQTTAQAGPTFDANYLPKQGAQNGTETAQAVAPETQRQEAPAADQVAPIIQTEKEGKPSTTKDEQLSISEQKDNESQPGNRIPTQEESALISRHTKIDKTLDLMSDAQIDDVFARANLAGKNLTNMEKRDALKQEHPDDIEPLLKPQPAQPAANAGEGAGASQPTQAAPNQSALDRIAAGNAWFGNELKARNWVQKNGLADTHDVRMTKPGRFEVVAKTAQAPANTGPAATNSVADSKQDSAKSPEATTVDSPDPEKSSNLEFIKAMADARKELPPGFEIRPELNSVSLMENGRYAVNGLGRNAAGVQEAVRQAKLRAAQASAPETAKLSKKEQARIQRETEAQVYRDLLANADMVGKSIDDLTAEIAKRAPESKPETVAKMAKALQKEILAKQAEIEKNKHRDPAVLQAAMDSAKPNGMAADDHGAFNAGFAHAMAGKTASTLTGDKLAAMQDGYKAAKAWMKTEEGAAFYEGRPSKKLQNTGVDLRRHWELMKAELAKNESDITKAWRNIEKATNRADIFAQFMPDGVKPGFKVYVTDLRNMIPTFKEWVGRGRWYGSHNYRSRYSKSTKTDQDYRLEGSQYPGELDSEAQEKFRTDEAYRIEYFRSKAAEYMDKVRRMTAFMDGAVGVKGAAEAFEKSMIQEIKRYPSGTVSDYVFTDLGEELKSLTHEYPSVVAKFRASSDWAQALVEKEETIALPDRAKPLTPPKLDRVTREQLADHRNGKDVTPQQFKDTFGFADVGFGNWVGAKQDQDHLNYAYDAFMDLAKRMGTDTKNVGMGMHFTIGALGHGKFAAHFQPVHPGPNGVVQVINLTNTKGDGTVSHEWTHGLDHNMGGEWKNAKNFEPSVRSMVLNALTKIPLSEEAVNATAKRFLIGGAYWTDAKRGNKIDGAIRGVQHYKNDGETAYKINADKMGKDYWGNNEELIARAAEAWFMDTLGGVNSYLVNPGWVGDGAVTADKGYRGTPYPSGEERKRTNAVFEALAKAIVWKDGKPTVTVEDFKKHWDNPAQAGMDRVKFLSVPENMRAYRDEITAIKEEQERKVEEERAARRAEKQAQADQAAAEERARADKLAAEQLAQLEALDPPKPDEAMGPLDDSDLEAIFDQAAAELREEKQEQPDAPAPGEKSQPESVEAKPSKPAKEYVGRRWTDENGNKRSVLSYQGGNTVSVATIGKEGTETMTPEQVEASIEAGRSRPANLSEAIKQHNQKKTGAADTARIDKSASQLIADAAKMGVKGIDEALTGLTKLFGGGPNQLNSFPAGFDEETYKKAKPHFEAALASFQAAGKSLKDLFKLLIEHFGDGVKMYAIQFAKDKALTSNLGQQDAAPKSPSATVAGWVQEKLATGQKIDWKDLFDTADKAWGGTQAEGTYSVKDAYDAMEMGMNRYILANPQTFTPNVGTQDALLAVGRLQALTEQLVTQTKRTAEQDEFQQFSTVPAFAYVANWVSGVNANDQMMEPSAGIGGLAIFARNAGAELVLNELSSRRADVLREVFPTANVFTENAEQINNILPDDIKPTVVVMNPPFSASAGRLTGERDTKIGAQHVEQALKRLDDGGRLVAIVGEGMAMDKPSFKAWWAKIGKEYDVRAVIPVDGKGYAKYGTTFSNALLVIDKVAPKAGRKVETTPASDYSELLKLLAEIRNDRPATTLREDKSAQRDSAESERQGLIPTGTGTDGVGADSRQPGDVGRPGTGGGRGLGKTGTGGGSAGRSGRPGKSVPDSGQPAVGGSDQPGGSRTDSSLNPGGLDQTGITVSGATNQSSELTNSVFENYQPQRLQIPGAQAHPGALVQSAAMASVLPPAAKYTPNLPAESITEGKLSIAQLEAVVYAGQSHGEMLNETVSANDVTKFGLKEGTQYRRGFFIGDGTGVGKGREISGIILDNLRQGRKKAIWISEKQGLMNDAKRDFGGVGGNENLIFNQSDTGSDEQSVKATDGILFTTYSTLKMGMGGAAGTVTKPPTLQALTKTFPNDTPITLEQLGRTYNGTVQGWDAKKQKVFVVTDAGQSGWAAFSTIRTIKGVGVATFNADTVKNISKPSAKSTNQSAVSRIDQIVNWVGPDFDGVIAFDEAHNAGNAIQMKGERGTSDPAQQALAVVELQRRLPNARVVYVSATGATEVNNLAYATRLGLWGQGTPFASVHEFVAQMQAGGLATMELVARDMKQMGAYLARSLSFDGVTYGRLEHQLTDLQTDIYNRLSDGWQVTLQNFNKALELTGATKTNGSGQATTKNGKAVSAAKAAYWGAQQRFFNQIITSMQMPAVLEQMEKDLAEGKALVLQLVNTNEAQQERALEKRKDEGESTDLEDLDLTPRDMLLQLVEKSFPVVQMEEVIDANGNRKTEPVLNSNGEPVQNREAVAMRDKLLEDLKAIRVPDGPMEIILNHFGPDRVAEVTGRKQRVVRKADKNGDVKAQVESRGSSANRADADAFMADKKQILIFSNAGGTGYSFQADLTKKNQRKRAHYLIQPGWRADKAVQGFGRTHRTNQASAPHYWLASTNIPAQKRFLSAIARRLDMLGAMTKGQRDTANQGMFSEKDNLESKYAQQAIHQLVKDVRSGQVPGMSFADFTKLTGLDNMVDPNTGQIAEANLPSTSQFLNRMLSMKLDTQDSIFAAFISRMEEKIDIAAQRGELDGGMETIKAISTKIVTDDVVYTDPKTGADTRLVGLELTLPNTFYPLPQEKTQGAPIEWVKNIRSGKVWAKVLSGNSTLRDGSIVNRYRMLGTGGTQVTTEDKLKGRDGKPLFETIQADQAAAMWDQESNARPATITKSENMIVGALLPIWDRLNTGGGTLRVMRTQTQDGQRLLGRVVEGKDLDVIRQRLNVASPESKMPAAEVMKRILKGEPATLANGWRLERVTVSNDLRIEIKMGYTGGAVINELIGYGAYKERIQWLDRVFVPTGVAGVPVLEKIFQSKPVVKIGDTLKTTGEDSDLSDGAKFSQNLLSPKSLGPKPTLDQIQRLVDKVQQVAKNVIPITIVGNPSQIPGVVSPVGAKPTGAVIGGKIYLFADNIRSIGDAYVTIFHELFHLGLKQVLPAEDYAALLRKFSRNLLVQRFVREWKASPEGIERSADMNSEAYDALAAEEALAMISEELHTNRGIGTNGTPSLVKAILSWLSDVADRIGLPTNFGEWMRGLTRTDAEKFVSDMVRAAMGGEKNLSRTRNKYGTSPNTGAEQSDIRFRSFRSETIQKAGDVLNEAFNHPGTVSKWHTTVGSMYNLAERSPAFKKVFDAAQGFLNDVSYYATEAADMAPKILPKLESWKDMAKSPISNADNEAVGKPVFQGTLSWARDVSGKPVRIEELEAAAADMTTEQKAQDMLRAGKLDPSVLRMWQGMKEEQYAAAVNSRYESTMLRPGVVWTDAELKRMFNLNDAQIGLYKEFRKSIDASIDNTAKAGMLRVAGKGAQALRDMVMDAPTAEIAGLTLRDHFQALAGDEPGKADQHIATANQMMDLADKAEKLKKEGYAPLSRFGQYTVDVVVDGERKYFGLFESKRAANQYAAKAKAEFGAGNVAQGTLSQREFEMFQGITPESLELFGNMLGLDSEGSDAQDKAFQTYLRLTKANRSAMKKMIHRKGIEGYSEDVGRVLAAFVYSNARQTAGALNLGRLGEAVSEIPKAQGELKDVAIGLQKYITQPVEEAQAIRGLMFAQYLGGSVASALVNLTQPMAVSFPYLSQFGGGKSFLGGAKRAAAALTKAYADMAKNTTLEKALQQALHAAEEQGVVAPQEVHQLMAQARGQSTLRGGDGTKVGDFIAKSGNAFTKLALGWGKLFGVAEQINRRATFIAAYRMAVENGNASPAEFATKAVNETQFINNRGNKMQWGRGAVGATLMTFKSYSINYLELLHRMATKQGPEGKMAAALMLGMLVLMAGAGGLPFADDLNDLVDFLAERMGYNFSTKKAKQEFLEGLLGKPMADFVDRGITGLPGSPIDVSGRMSMANLIPGTGLLLEKRDHSRDAQELLGPVGDMAKRAFEGANAVLDGDLKRAALAVSPKAISNAAQGANMLDKGYYADAKGFKVLSTTPGEAVGKAIGFQPQSVSMVQEANAINQRMKDTYALHAERIRSEWAKGIFEHDSDQIQKAREMLADWNAKNPGQTIIVRIPDVMKKAREMAKDKDQRIADTAPKAMRAQLKQEIQQRKALQ